MNAPVAFARQGAPALHPDYSSWLHQVELWFAKIERDVIARSILTSVKDLGRNLMRYIRQHNQHATPFK